jgi:hypothetical protein
MRAREILQGIDDVINGPTLNEAGPYRKNLNTNLRRHNVAQFAIIYAYSDPSQKHPNGFIAFRAIRHSRVKDVFRGVREVPTHSYRR